MAETGTCGHTGCSCPTADDDTFCSDHCRKAHEQDIVEIACDCGHSSCE